MQGDERRKVIRRENTYTLQQQPTSLCCYRKQPSKLNPVTVEAMNILFDLLSLVAPDTFTMALLSIHVPVTFVFCSHMSINYMHKIISALDGWTMAITFNNFRSVLFTSTGSKIKFYGVFYIFRSISKMVEQPK